jgi:carboxypeptidase C (cathepsin A)
LLTRENPLLAAAAAACSSEAHMFWWLYHSPQRVDNGTTPWPTVLWLQGGPVSE